MVKKEKCYINCVLLCKRDVPMEVSGPGERRCVDNQQVQRLEGSSQIRAISYTGEGHWVGRGQHRELGLFCDAHVDANRDNRALDHIRTSPVYI